MFLEGYSCDNCLLIVLFQLENDMENYARFKIMGSVKKIRMKPNTVPTRFSNLPIVDPGQAAGSTSTREHQAMESTFRSEHQVVEVAAEGTLTSGHPGSSTTCKYLSLS